MRGESQEALAWFERGRHIGELRAELREHKALLVEIREICSGLSTAASPEGESLWPQAREYLSFFVLLYKASRMVPWGLVFLAAVSVWKFLMPHLQSIIRFFGA
jgi:hypothetical protein